MSEKLVSVVKDGLTERPKDGSNKLVPKLGPDGKPLIFDKLVLSDGQLHQNEGESAEDYADRMMTTLDEIDQFYSDWNGREGISGVEGFCNYGMDLVSRAMATPEKTSHKEANRFQALTWIVTLGKDDPYYVRWSDAGKAGKMKGANRELDKIIGELGDKIPGVVVSK